MLDILEWALDVIGLTYTRLDGRYLSYLSLHGTYFFFIICINSLMKVIVYAIVVL